MQRKVTHLKQITYTFLILFVLVWILSLHIILDIRVLGSYFVEGSPAALMVYTIFLGSLATLFYIVLRFAEKRWSLLIFLGIIIGIVLVGWIDSLENRYIAISEVFDLAIYSLIFSAAFTIFAIFVGNYLLTPRHKYALRSKKSPD